MNQPFHSRWRAQLSGFVRFKQQDLGQPYRRSTAALHSFDCFAATQSRTNDFAAVLRAWLHCYSGRKPVTISNYLCTIRQFCRFRQRSNPCAFVPDREFAPKSTEGPPFLPFIFTLDEIKRILTDTDRVSGTARTRRCFHTLVLVLYCTGLRIGEALRLRKQDVDLRQRCFHVGPSKGRVRWVPFHADWRACCATGSTRMPPTHALMH